MMARIGVTLAAAAIIGACAQASSPPGGEPDRYYPRILSTVPDTNAVVPGFSGSVIFRFDETLSERGVREEHMVLVSPETGEVEISRKGKEIRVQLEGGWQPGRIYHVMVMPGVQDRFGNARPQAYELVFSTGPDILPNAIAGLVTDRLTARTVANARVLLTNTSDSTTYVTLTDTAGFFAVRSLPLGAYQALAFLDANRNREIEFAEPRDVRIASLVTPRDTSVVELAVLAPDTTPARLLRAEPGDTTTVTIAFDDFIPPNEAFGNVAVSLWQLPDSTPGPMSGSLMHPRDRESRLRALRDTASAKPPAAAVPSAIAPSAADTMRLPTQNLVYVPAQPLAPATRYRIIVNGIRNMLAIQGGGGTATFETPARARRTAPRDTTGTPADTTALPPTDTTTRSR